LWNPEVLLYEPIIVCVVIWSDLNQQNVVKENIHDLRNNKTLYSVKQCEI